MPHLTASEKATLANATARRNADIESAPIKDAMRKVKASQPKLAALLQPLAAGATLAEMQALVDKCNIDGSTAAIKLTANDFQAFGNAYASASAWEQTMKAPSNLLAVVNGANVTLTWVNNATDPAASVRILRNGTEVGTVAPGTALYTDTPGNGTWTYQTQAFTSLYPSPISNTATATVGVVTPPVAGWSDLSLAPGAVAVYVASSGNDGAAGTHVAPLRTIAAGYARLRDGQPDQLLLKCGDTFTTDTIGWAKASGDPTKPMIVANYGTGPRPKIRSNGTAFYLGTQNKRGITFAHLDLAPTSPSDGSSAFLFFTPWSYVRIEGCYMAGYAANIVTQELSAGVWGDNNTIHRCVFADSNSPGQGHSQNFFAGQQRGLTITECVMDRGGYLENTMFSHDFYGSETNDVLKMVGNTFARAGSHGYQNRGGGENRLNLSLGNPINGFVGDSANRPSVFTDNVAIDSRDINPTDRRGFGFVLSGDIQIERNVVAHNVHGTDAIVAYDLDGIKSGTFKNNVGYDWGHPANNVGWPTLVQWEQGGSGPVAFSGNLLAFKAGQFGVCVRNDGRGLTAVQYSANRYFTVNPLGGYGQFQSSAGNAVNTFAAWQALAGETGSSFATQPVVDVSVAAYLTSISITPGSDPLATYMNEARKQERSNWRTEFTAEAYVRWAQTKFGVANPTNP